jgi:hypothetical protein
VAERILSRYTAFLALEPNDTLKACLSCKDESTLDTGVDDHRQPSEQDSLFQAYPNPFNAHTVIKLHLGQGQRQGDLEVGIYNLLGQKVRTYSPEQTLNGREFTFRWDGYDDDGLQVATGTYLVVARTASWRQTIKLTMLK